MKKILVSYGDLAYKNSLKRLKSEAISTGEFDDVKIYTDNDLPEYILSSPLFRYKRGGGYWLWKPWVIYDSLRNLEDGDIVVYSDSGNKLYQSEEWKKWWRLLNDHNGIFFMYGASMEERTRSNLLSFFQDIKNLPNLYQILSGIIFIKRSAISVIEEWLNIMLNHPNFVIDVLDNEKASESKRFIEHRHDQAVLSCVVYKNEYNLKLKILWQQSESRRKGQSVFNARISDDKIRNNPLHFEKWYRRLIKICLVTPLRNLKLFIYKKLL